MSVQPVHALATAVATAVASVFSFAMNLNLKSKTFKFQGWESGRRGMGGICWLVLSCCTMLPAWVDKSIPTYGRLKSFPCQIFCVY